MVLRLIQLTAGLFLLFVGVLHFSQPANQQGVLEAFDLARDQGGPFFEAHWQPIYFGLIAILTAWLFYVTSALRPVVALFAALGFFLVAMMEDPSAASFKTALDGLTETVLGGIDALKEG